MARAFAIGRNPHQASRLPYLLRLPAAGEGDLVSTAKEIRMNDQETPRAL